MQEFILQGRVLWSFDHEIAEISISYKLTAGLISFVGPLHNHRGLIALGEEELII